VTHDDSIPGDLRHCEGCGRLTRGNQLCRFCWWELKDLESEPPPPRMALPWWRREDHHREEGGG